MDWLHQPRIKSIVSWLWWYAILYLDADLDMTQRFVVSTEIFTLQRVRWCWIIDRYSGGDDARLCTCRRSEKYRHWGWIDTIRVGVEHIDDLILDPTSAMQKRLQQKDSSMHNDSNMAVECCVDSDYCILWVVLDCCCENDEWSVCQQYSTSRRVLLYMSFTPVRGID